MGVRSVMDESIAGNAGNEEAEFRGAVDWWIRLEGSPPDPRTLRDFANWLSEHATHRKAFARVETVWQTVQTSLVQCEAIGPPSAPASRNEGA